MTLSHAGREDSLAAALRSVAPHVDRCLVVATDDCAASHRVARDIVGDKLVARHGAWIDDFGAARTAALDLAAATGAAWAVIVDSDEELLVGRGSLAALLDAVPPEVESLTTDAEDGSYAKVRVLRLPCAGRFVGVTHEYFDRRGREQRPLDSVRFRERQKDAAELEQKFDRDIRLLERETRRRPMENALVVLLRRRPVAPRSPARGDRRLPALCRAGRVERGDRVGLLPRGRAVAPAGTPREAVERCVVGIGLHPGIPELPWLAGFASWRAGRYRDAVAFSNLAIVHGEYCGLAGEVARGLFRHLPALYEGPFDVLRYAYRALGEESAADQAERDFRAAYDARLRDATSWRAARPG